MIKAVLIDLGQTIVDNHYFSFDAGLNAIYHQISHQGYDLRTFLTESKHLSETLYANRDQYEVRIGTFIKTLITTLKTKYDQYSNQEINHGLVQDLDYELIFFEAAEHDKLIDGVTNFLEMLKSRNIPIIIVSNSTFPEHVLEALLKKLAINHYFNEVISSANCGIRKPYPTIFNLAINRIKNYLPDITNQEIAFIGNDYQVDILGAFQVGLTPLWLNHEPILNRNYPLDIYQFNNYQQLMADWDQINQKTRKDD